MIDYTVSLDNVDLFTLVAIKEKSVIATAAFQGYCSTISTAATVYCPLDVGKVHDDAPIIGAEVSAACRSHQLAVTPAAGGSNAVAGSTTISIYAKRIVSS
jgi:hypothetical protein